MPERMVYNHSNCWKGLQNGEPDALGFLYDAYADKLFEAASWITDNRELAKDALQEVFVDIWSYRASLGAIHHPQSYLIRVLHNIILKKMKAYSPGVHFHEAMEMNYHDQNAEEIMIAEDTEKENATRLRRACLQLTERQQTVIRLRFYDGLSYHQIAEKLRMNYQSVNNLVFRTLVSLRKEI